MVSVQSFTVSGCILKCQLSPWLVDKFINKFLNNILIYVDILEQLYTFKNNKTM